MIRQTFFTPKNHYLMKTFLSFLASALLAGTCFAGSGNPVIPGYFADPTLKRFGDTYYLYATTDGSGAGFGPAQVWTSKDAVNWTLLPMNWPDSHWIWAPDVMQHTDGRYYYYYCQPCQVHVGVSDTPRGPWQNLLGESEAVLIPDRMVTGAITLDGQTFVDDDGSVYMYWGTWGIYKDFGCGAGRLAPDLKSFTETRLIPNTEATDFFEAPFVLKRNGVYYFMYSSGSCHDETYRVQYATSDKPMGPYTYRGCILQTNEDGTVHGPGHHSVLEQDEEYYIVYHRHDNPHSNRGFHRQICIDKLEFEADGSIRPVVPTHDGVGPLAPLTVTSPNLALGASVTASSYYDKDFRPEYAVDDNNGTLWRPQTDGQEWIQLDLGKARDIRTVWTQFEYGTQFYQYLIETSNDAQHWTVFADKRQNRLAGSPMVDFGKTKARYLRLTYTGGQKRGFGGAIWNIKVFADVQASSPQQWMGLTAADFDGTAWQNNEGMLAGSFTLTSGKARRTRVDGTEAVVLEPGSEMVFTHPQLGQGDYTATAWIYKEGKWTSQDLPVTAGKMILKAAASEPLILTNIRYYNWLLTPSEKTFDASTPLTRQPVADTNTQGLLVSLSAEDYAVRDTLPYLDNKGTLKGYFEARQEPVVVEEKAGRRAFRFDGRQVFTSSFALPATVRDNAPYTMEAWVLNDSIAENECIADFTTSHDELEKLMLNSGTEPRCGLVNHYGWYEDAGYREVKGLEEQWYHLYVCFDGRMERVYVDGQLVSEKDIQLLIQPSQFVTLGRNAEGEWPFSGWVQSIRMWDECVPYEK
jgi:hypothetical protein